jgi:hypothetical protein
MPYPNPELVGLLSNGAHGSLHQPRDFCHWGLAFGVRLKIAMISFGPCTPLCPAIRFGR